MEESDSVDADDEHTSTPLTVFECRKRESICHILGDEIRLTPGSKAQVQILWRNSPSSVLLIRKLHNESAAIVLGRLGLFLKSKGLRVFVEQDTNTFETQPEFETFNIVSKVDKALSDYHRPVDFIICFGGDGTLLYLNSLFQREGLEVPPVAAFARGSLGFLTPYDVTEAEAHCERILNANIVPVPVSLRMRIRCELWRRDESQADFTYQVLNECLIDRGGSSIMSSLDLYVDGEQVTLVQADGLIVSTPTGSTAYSMSAGGSMVAPTVPAILITPVCPHTLSFRPAVLPDSSVIIIRVPNDARDTACASFDGGHRRTLNRGDEVRFSMSTSPFPTINARSFNNDWFKSIVHKLHWNVRRPQEALSSL